MKKNVLFIICFSLFLFIFYPPVFAGYEELIGKRIEIHGPYGYNMLGVALDKQTCDQLISALSPRNKAIFDTLLQSYQVMRIEGDTKALVLDTEPIEGRAHIIILSGFYKGMSGWIPLEWLSGNETPLKLKDSYRYSGERYNVEWLNEG